MIASDYELALKRGFLEPCYYLLKLRETALVREVAGMDQDIAQRELGVSVVSVRDANEARPTQSWG
jgi:hypothetical protein